MSPTPLITIILPVHDAEEFLPDCLDSMLGQSFRNFEVLAVDDDSQDGSRKILDDYAARDPRLRVVGVSHRGAAAARNVGLDRAKGDWLMFVDADDMLATPELLTEIAASISFGVEVLTFETTVGPNRTLLCEFDIPPVSTAERVLDSDDFAEMIANEKLNVLWDKVYRRDLIEMTGCRFKPGLTMGEDLLFNIGYFRSARTMLRLGIVGYAYRRNNAASITRRYLPDKYSDLMLVNDELRQQITRCESAPILGAAEYIRAKNVYSCIKDLHHGSCNLPLTGRISVARSLKSAVPKVKVRGVGVAKRALGATYNLCNYRLLFFLAGLTSLAR